MHNANEDGRIMATGALSQLVYNGSSVAAAVRSVLRIATLLKHPRWQVWSYLQLSDISEDRADVMKSATLQTATQMLDDFFKNSDAARNSAVDTIFADYNYSRRVTEDRLVYQNIDHIEADLRILEARLASGSAMQTDQHNYENLIRVMAKIKNRAQLYLMTIECGDESSEHSPEP